MGMALRLGAMLVPTAPDIGTPAAKNFGFLCSRSHTPSAPAYTPVR